jgi:hypothetical protein
VASRAGPVVGCREVKELSSGTVGCRRWTLIPFSIFSNTIMWLIKRAYILHTVLASAQVHNIGENKVETGADFLCCLSHESWSWRPAVHVVSVAWRTESELLPSSQNNCTCWLLLFTFDHSSYLKTLWKYYLFCYYMFYHHIYFKYIIIVFTFAQIFWIRWMVKRAL